MTHFHRLRQNRRQLEREAVDWFATVFWAAVLTALILGSVWGHAAVARGEGDPMPILQVLTHLPSVSK